MFPGILALVGRSLRVDARSLQSHLARFGLLVAIFVSLCVAHYQSIFFGAPGLRFFYSTAYLNVTFMSLMGIGFFSTSISEEKEEHTLGLMLMAGISPLGILIGKSGGRLVQALLLIAVQYPFTQLAITMGGVSASQVNAVYLGLTAYMILLAGFGVLCSTIGTNNRSAGSWMIIGLAMYALIPLFAIKSLASAAKSGFRWPFLAPLLEAVSTFSVFQQMGTILTTGFGDSILSWQVISNTCVGIGCFGLAWAVFGFCQHNADSEAATRGVVSVGRGMVPMFSPGRAWRNPFVWKDFYFVSGGFGFILIRLAFCYGLWHVVRELNGPNYLVSAYQAYLSLSIAIDAGRILAGSLRDEIRGQTIDSLVMLPLSTVFVVYTKFAGALLGWIPVALVDLAITVGTTEGNRNFAWILENPRGFCIASFFVLIPNLAAVLALYLRWGSVLLATGISIGLFFGMMSIFRGNDPYCSGITFLVLAFCFVCHLAIVLRISSLAEK